VQLLQWVLVLLYTMFMLFQLLIYNFVHDFYFRHPSTSVLVAAVRTVGNIVTGDDKQTQVVSRNQLK
jgi:hypothetical protein